MPRLYIVRHGNTFDKGDVVCRVGGRTDLPLSKSGRIQAESLGLALSDVVFDRALVSPLLRTRLTAQAILSAQQRPVEMIFEESLVEVDYGPDEGKPEADVIARIGETALAAWDRDATVPPGWKVDAKACRESWKVLLKETKGTELVVTSNGVARFVLDLVEHNSVARKLKTGAYGILEGEGDHWRITAWNVRPPSKTV